MLLLHQRAACLQAQLGRTGCSSSTSGGGVGSGGSGLTTEIVHKRSVCVGGSVEKPRNRKLLVMGPLLINGLHSCTGKRQQHPHIALLFLFHRAACLFIGSARSIHNINNIILRGYPLCADNYHCP